MRTPSLIFIDQTALSRESIIVSAGEAAAASRSRLRTWLTLYQGSSQTWKRTKFLSFKGKDLWYENCIYPTWKNRMESRNVFRASGDSPLLATSTDELRLGIYQTFNSIKILLSDLPCATPCRNHPKWKSVSNRYCSNSSTKRVGLLEPEGAKIATVEATYPQQMWASINDLSQFDHQLFGATGRSNHQSDNCLREVSQCGKVIKCLDCRTELTLTASIRRLLGYETSLPVRTRFSQC